jgi:hypothetical protein
MGARSRRDTRNWQSTIPGTPQKRYAGSQQPLISEAHLIDHDLDQALNAANQAVFLAEHSASCTL